MKAVFLGDVIQNVRSGFASGENTPDGIIQLRMNNVATDGKIIWDKIRRVPIPKNVNELLAKQGDIFFNATNSPELVGKSALFKGHSEAITFSNHFMRLRVNPSIADSAYISRVLQEKWSKGIFTGLCKQWVNQATVSKDSLLNLEIPLPNLKEQKRIAAILDQADELRRARRKSIDRLNDLSQAIFYEMFGNLSGFPKKALRDLGKVSTGSTPPTKEASYFDGEIPFVTPGDLGSGMDAKRTLSLEGSKKSRLVQEGAILVCCIGATIGKMDIAQEECAFNQQINAIQWGDDVDPVYGLFAMGAIRDEIVHKGKGASTTLPILKKSEFEKLMIGVPPKELQVRFSKMVNRINGNISLLKKDLFVREHLFSSLQKKAFSEKI